MHHTHYEFCTIESSLKTDDAHDWYWEKITHVCIVPSTSSLDNCLMPLLGVHWVVSHFADYDPTDDTIIVYERGTEKPVAAFFPITIH